MLSSTLCTLLFVSGVLPACNYGLAEFPRGPTVPVSKFSYDDVTGPLNWFGLNETTNAMCAEGKNQSPIVLGSSYLTSGSSLNVAIPSYPHGAEFENLGTNVEIVVNGTFVHDGQTYKLKQYHIHTPAEHRVNNQYYVMEVHFVLQTSQNATAVIGFLVELSEEGYTFPLLKNTFAAIEEIATPGNTTITAPLEFSEILAHLKGNKVFKYSGSLTTPPCSEGVTWFISQEPIYISVHDFLRVKKVVKFNARYSQDKLKRKNLLEVVGAELKSVGAI